MCQRVMLAVALAGAPDLLIADEPTTGLDATTQATILALILDQARARRMATLFITHDLDLARAYAERVVVHACGPDRRGRTERRAVRASASSIFPSTDRRDTRFGRPCCRALRYSGRHAQTRCGHTGMPVRRPLRPRRWPLRKRKAPAADGMATATAAPAGTRYEQALGNRRAAENCFP